MTDEDGGSPRASPSRSEDDDFDVDDDPRRVPSSPPSSSLSPSNPKTNIPTLTAAILSALTTGGTTYAFGLYAAALKHSLRLSQSELDTISATFFCAGLLSWMPGMAADRFGPRNALASGGVIMAVGLMLYWFVATQNPIFAVSRPLVVPTLSVLGVLVFMSCALVTGSVFKLIVGCCGRGTKGSAVGAAKGYVGLGSGAYACLFESIRGENWSDLDFLPMAAFFAVTAATVPALCLLDGRKKDARSGPKRDVATPWHFRIVYGGLLGLGAVVVGTSLLELYEDSPEVGPAAKAAGKAGGGGGAEEEGGVEGGGGGGGKGGGGGLNYPLALAIVSIWVGPILSMLCLPVDYDVKRGHHAALPQDDDDIDDGGAYDYGDGTDGGVEEVVLVPHEPGGEADDENDGKPGSGKDCFTGIRLGGDGGGKRDILSDHDGEENGSGGNDDGDGGNLELPASTDGRGGRSLSKASVAGGGEGNCLDPEPGIEREHLIDDDRHTSAAIAPATTAEKNLNLSQMLRTVPAWLLLYTCTVLAGGGTVMTNNVGQMSEALRFPSVTASASLALFSAAQSAARVATGAVSESALSWTRFNDGAGVPRPYFLVVASVAGFLSHAVLTYATTEAAFVIGVTLSGAAFGMIWPLMVLIVGECFGTAHVGANYMFYDGFTSAIGTLLLSKFVAQEVYESHIVHNEDHERSLEGMPSTTATAEGGAGDELTCYGVACFRASHAIVSGLSLTCVVSSLGMVCATRDVYGDGGSGGGRRSRR